MDMKGSAEAMLNWTCRMASMSWSGYEACNCAGKAASAFVETAPSETLNCLSDGAKPRSIFIRWRSKLKLSAYLDIAFGSSESDSPCIQKKPLNTGSSPEPVRPLIAACKLPVPFSLKKSCLYASVAASLFGFIQWFNQAPPLLFCTTTTSSYRPLSVSRDSMASAHASFALDCPPAKKTFTGVDSVAGEISSAIKKIIGFMNTTFKQSQLVVNMQLLINVNQQLGREKNPLLGGQIS